MVRDFSLLGKGFDLYYLGGEAWPLKRKVKKSVMDITGYRPVHPRRGPTARAFPSRAG